MKKILVFMLTLAGLLLPMNAFAQDEDIPFNGLILDRNLHPVKNAKIYVGNPKVYTRSDKQGRFGLTNVLPLDTLTVELKKQPKILIPVDGRKSIKIVLAGDGETPHAEYDEEIANTGYGYVKRREYTGVSSGISGSRLRATGARDILGALKGLVPGLNITGSAGNYSVDIRGQKSIMLSNEPLYIVDGVQINSIDHISLYDVDHVEVLKDASQYGSRGANGAILVTTKTGLTKK